MSSQHGIPCLKGLEVMPQHWMATRHSIAQIIQAPAEMWNGWNTATYSPFWLGKWWSTTRIPPCILQTLNKIERILQDAQYLPNMTNVLWASRPSSIKNWGGTPRFFKISTPHFWRCVCFTCLQLVFMQIRLNLFDLPNSSQFPFSG